MSSQKKLPDWFWLATVLLFALIVRLPLLNGSFWLDEAAQALESTRPFSQQLQIRDDFQPPLLHLLLHTAQYASRSEWWLRTVGALIPGLVTIFFTYKIGLLLKDKKVAIAASVLMATSSFHIFYSQELRQYSLPAALATASWFVLIKHWKKRQQPNLRVLAIFAIIQAAGLYSSYLYPFAILGQVIWIAVMYRKHLFHWIGAYTGAGVAFLPWVPYFLGQLAAGTELRSSLPGWDTVVSSTQLTAVPMIGSKFVFGVADVELNVLFIGFTGLLLLQIGRATVTKKFSKAELINVSAIISWLAAPIIFAWLVSFFVPVLQPKRVLFCLPAFYLILSLLAFRIKGTFTGWSWLRSAPLLIWLLLVVNVITTAQYWYSPQLQRENWRQLVQEINLKYPKRTIIVFSFPEPFAPWRWYAPSDYPALATQQILLDQTATVSTLKEAIQFDYIITFDYLRDLTDPNHLLNSQLIAYGYKEIEVIDYPLIGFVRIYSRPEAVISYK